MDEADFFDSEDWCPEDREQAAEVFRLDAQLAGEQARLDALMHADPLGCIWFPERLDG
jgi:hypothetical protein